MKRRSLLGGLAALPVAHALGRPSGRIVQRPLARVIVDNDFAGDPDGLVALAHQLLAPTTRTVLVTTTALDAKLAALAGLDAGRSAAAGARLAAEMLRYLRPGARPPIVAGESDAAARAIVAEALRDDPLPLVLTCGGPLTNVAAALRLRPDIAGRMRLVWIGGSTAGGAEYNLDTDPAAVRFVFDDTTIPVLQIPQEEYRRFQVSVAELEGAFRSISPLAGWLVDQYRHLPPFVQPGGTLTFGDSPLVTATAFDQAATPFTVRRVNGREVRMAHSLDPRLNYADLVALLARGTP
ncbi:MAG: nucleoside hydrolase [Massilia sp.]